jgi:hypothetical protein
MGKKADENNAGLRGRQPRSIGDSTFLQILSSMLLVIFIINP